MQHHNKKRKDVVSSLCLAASTVIPKHAYVEIGVEVYEVEGGQEALIMIIDRYYLRIKF